MTETTTPKTEDRDALLSALCAMGSAWAHYGLTIGRTALETSAQTLQKTAVALGQLAEAIERRRSPEPEERDEDRDAISVEAPQH